jgi:hypothetical protein
MSEPIPCFQIQRSIEACRTCGKHPGLVHVPTRYAGLYCEKCCPACNRRSGKGD